MWTYNSNVVSPKDQVRLLIGDKDGTDQQLADEEILFLLEDAGSTIRAAIAAAESLAARYARRNDYAIGRQIQESASQRSTAYIALAKRLRQRAARAGMTPLAGGISVAQKVTQRQNQDRIDPSFAVDQMEEPGTIHESLPLPDDSYPLP